MIVDRAHSTTRDVVNYSLIFSHPTPDSVSRQSFILFLARKKRSLLQHLLPFVEQLKSEVDRMH